MLQNENLPLLRNIIIAMILMNILIIMFVIELEPNAIDGVLIELIAFIDDVIDIINLLTTKMWLKGDIMAFY